MKGLLTATLHELIKHRFAVLMTMLAALAATVLGQWRQFEFAQSLVGLVLDSAAQAGIEAPDAVATVAQAPAEFLVLTPAHYADAPTSMLVGSVVGALVAAAVGTRLGAAEWDWRTAPSAFVSQQLTTIAAKAVAAIGTVVLTYAAALLMNRLLNEYFTRRIDAALPGFRALADRSTGPAPLAVAAAVLTLAMLVALSFLLGVAIRNSALALGSALALWGVQFFGTSGLPAAAQGLPPLAAGNVLVTNMMPLHAGAGTYGLLDSTAPPMPTWALWVYVTGLGLAALAAAAFSVRRSVVR